MEKVLFFNIKLINKNDFELGEMSSYDKYSLSKINKV